MSSPVVSTTYADGSGNTVRPESRTYPNGRTVAFDYGDADGINDRLSRIEALVDDDDTVLAEYQYLGLGAVVQQDSPEADLRSTLVSLTGTNDPDTGDIYSGLDRFGRVTDVRWRDVSASSDLSRVQYGYDRASNRTYRKNPTDPSSHHDWAYGYDGLQRLKHADRGTLASPPTGVTDPQFAQCWSLDATGNWAGFRQANTGNPWSLVQSRTANPVNEITGIANSVGAAWAQPAYDATGNMTAIPQPADPTGAYTATYDAWNRLVKLIDPATGHTVQENVYDARGYRIVKKSYTAGSLAETRHYYYTNGWRCVEERLGTDPDSADAERQHVWGVRYIDDLVVRDRDTDTSGTLDERLYACQDGNWNTTAVVGTDGTVQERYEYDPYGDLSVLAPNFSPRTASSFDWNITYAGYRFDTTTGLYQVRFRFLHPQLAWTRRDLIGYRGGDINLLSYLFGSPISWVDPEGLQIMPSMPYNPPYRPTPPPLKPNIGSGTGTYHTTDHTIRFVVNNGTSCDEVQRNIYRSLASFSEFNGGANTVATVDIDGVYAYFNALGLMGWMSDRIGNADKSPVILSIDDGTSTVTATTLTGHMLEGQRKWWVRVQPNAHCGCTVWVYTSAYERKIGWMNDVGARGAGTEQQMLIWDQYLINIFNEFGAPGFQYDLKHKDRDTQSAVPPSSW